MPFYRAIEAVHPPMEIGNDVNDRATFSCNFTGCGYSPIDAWEEDLMGIITAAGLAIYNTGTSPPDNGFIGRLVKVPTTGLYTLILDTGGTATERTHNNDGVYEHRSAQIIVGAPDYDAAHNQSLSIWRLLDGIYNTTLAP